MDPNVNQLHVLVIDSNSAQREKLLDALKEHEELTRYVHGAESVETAIHAISELEIDTVFIDPISVGISVAEEFIFRAREEMPWIVFVLYSDRAVIDSDANYYTGRRERWVHYYRLNKEIPNKVFCKDLFHVIHMCICDIRLGHSIQRSKIQKDFAARSFRPPEVEKSLKKYHQHFRKAKKTVFVMMQFGDTPMHEKISDAIKKEFLDYGIVGSRADDHRFHDSLLSNVKTYMHGCDFGVAVFDRITKDDFNPNVSFEIGYMMALGKPVLLLKDCHLQELHVDLVGELYHVFDVSDLQNTVSKSIKRWIASRI